jgi:DNA replication ATP-dependent helicase Dna2
MPGTGKTYLIVLLLKILLDRGNRILLSSYTHSALDNILKRFVEKYPALKNKVVRVASNPG